MPDGPGERFNGWGVMGLPFDTGHVLALRRFPASSVGPAYTSVWHRAAHGAWTMYVDVAPRFSCPRYFGRDVTRVVRTEIVLSWAGPRSLRVVTGSAGFHWDITFSPGPVTRLINAAAHLVPEPMWRRDGALAAIGRIAGYVLRAGRIRLQGRVPNGHRFQASPRSVWMVETSSAVVEGEDVGAPSPLDRQARLGDFRIPQRGLLAFGEGIFDATGVAARAPGSEVPVRDRV